MTPRDTILDLRARMGRSIVGQEHVVERLLIGLLAEREPPGRGPARPRQDARRSRPRAEPRGGLLAHPVHAGPPALGHHGHGGLPPRPRARASSASQPGPIFGNLVLADEINRAPAKVQAALLEAMEERQVTVAGTTHKLPAALHGHGDAEPHRAGGDLSPARGADGPLPHARPHRLPRRGVRRARSSASCAARRQGAAAQQPGRPRRRPDEPPDPASRPCSRPAPASHAVHVARGGREVHGRPRLRHPVPGPVRGRPPQVDPGRGEPARRASPSTAARGPTRGCRARDHVTPDDVQAVAHDCLRHRLMLSYEATAGGVTADRVVDEVLRRVAVA